MHLQLEENVRPIALSGDWIKLVDGSSTQSSTSQIAANAAGSTQKRRPGRRGRKPSAMVEVASDDCQDMSTDFTWWRGGTLSKLMFQRGILPCSMIRKAARQGNINKPTFSSSAGKFNAEYFLCLMKVVLCFFFLYVILLKSESIFTDRLYAYQVVQKRYPEYIMLKDMRLPEVAGSLSGGQQLKCVGTWHSLHFRCI